MEGLSLRRKVQADSPGLTGNGLSRPLLLLWFSRLAFAVLAIVLVHALYRYISYIGHVITYPYSLDYGEGIVWQQALLISGARMYGDIDKYPYIVFHYPPLYHLVVRMISSLGFDMLLVGRCVSVVSAGVIATMVFALTLRATGTAGVRSIAVAAAILAGLIVFTYPPVIEWSPRMRVDMLAVALSFTGVYLAVRSIERPALLYGAAIAFVLAVYTKQTALAAPIATFGVLLLRDPKRTIRAACFGIVVAAAALLYLTWRTDGGFLRHILLYNVNRFSAWNAVSILSGQVPRFGIYLLLAIMTLVVAWRQLPAQRGPGRVATIRQQLRQSEFAVILGIFTVYFGLTTAMTITVGKAGASDNYFIEWMCVWSAIIGIALGWALPRIWRNGHGRPGVTGLISIPWLPVLLIIQVLVCSPPKTAADPYTDPATLRQMAQLFQLVRAAHKPVLSDDMVLLIRAGKEVPLEPAIFRELASVGRWDQTKLIDLLNARTFAFIVTTSSGSKWDDDRYTRPVRAAIIADYPREQRYAGFVVLRP